MNPPQCPWGTSACGPLSTAKLMAVTAPGDDVVVVRLQLYGISRAAFSQPMRAAFKAHVASVAGVLASNVDLRYVADLQDASSEGALVNLASVGNGDATIGVDLQVAIMVNGGVVGSPSASIVASRIGDAIDDGSLASGLQEAGVVGVVSAGKLEGVRVVDRAAYERALNNAKAGSGGEVEVLGFPLHQVIIGAVVFALAALLIVIGVIACRGRRSGKATSTRVRILTLPPQQGGVEPCDRHTPPSQAVHQVAPVSQPRSSQRHLAAYTSSNSLPGTPAVGGGDDGVKGEQGFVDTNAQRRRRFRGIQRQLL